MKTSQQKPSYNTIVCASTHCSLTFINLSDGYLTRTEKDQASAPTALRDCQDTGIKILYTRGVTYFICVDFN